MEVFFLYFFACVFMKKNLMQKFKQTGRRHNPANGLLQHQSIKNERTADAGYARGIFYSHFLSFSNKFS